MSDELMTEAQWRERDRRSVLVPIVKEYLERSTCCRFMGIAITDMEHRELLSVCAMLIEQEIERTRGLTRSLR